MEPTQDRYQITPPVPERNGYNWWDVVDTQNNNLAVISISANFKQSQVWIHGMCAQLNRSEGPTGPHPAVLISEDSRQIG